jgi:hypothetical protein
MYIVLRFLLIIALSFNPGVVLAELNEPYWAKYISYDSLYGDRLLSTAKSLSGHFGGHAPSATQRPRDIGVWITINTLFSKDEPEHYFIYATNAYVLIIATDEILANQAVEAFAEIWREKTTKNKLEKPISIIKYRE